MNIETVTDLAEKIADMLGIYGGCKSNGDDGCEYDCNMIDRLPPKPCCRQGFVGLMEERIAAAVENDKKLETANIKP